MKVRTVMMFVLLASLGVLAAAPESLDQLATDSEAIVWAKYLGGNSLQVTRVLKGPATQQITLPDGFGINPQLQPGMSGLIFFKDRDNWVPNRFGVFTSVTDQNGANRIVGNVDPASLIRGIRLDIKRELYNIPVPKGYPTKAPMRLSIGNMVDAITDEPDGGARLDVETFNLILNHVLKVQGILAEGGTVGDMFDTDFDLTDFPQSEAPISGTPVNRRPARPAQKADRQICPAGATDISAMLSDDSDYFVNFTSFSFPMNGTTYTDGLYINSNGYVTFGGSYIPYWYFNINSPRSFFGFNPYATVAPLADDMDIETSGTISYLEASANEFIVCFDGVYSYYFGGTNSFLLHLYSDGSFTFEYDWIDGWQALIGWKVDDADQTLSGDWDLTRYDALTLGSGAEKHWYDRYDNDSDWIDYTTVTFEGNPDGDTNGDPYDPNSDFASAPAVVLPFASLDGCTLESIDWYRVDLGLDDTWILSAYIRSMRGLRSNFIDSVLGIFDANGQMVDYNDDYFPTYWAGVEWGDSMARAVLPGGTYYVAVTAWPDHDFTGQHTDGGAYGLNIDAYPADEGPLPLGDEDYIAAVLPFDFPFVAFWDYWPKNVIYINSNGYITLWQGEVNNYTETVDKMINGLPRVAAWWDDLDPSYWEGSGYPYGVWYLPDAESGSALIWYYGVVDYEWNYMLNASARLWFDGQIDIMLQYPNSTWDGITGYSLGLGLGTGPIDSLLGEYYDHGIADFQWMIYIIGDGWQTSLYEQCDGYMPYNGTLTYFGCYPYDYMTYDDEGHFIYLHVNEEMLNYGQAALSYGIHPENRFRYLSMYPFGFPVLSPYINIDQDHVERSLTVLPYTPGLLQFTAGAWAGDYYFWGFFWMDPYNLYGYARGYFWGDVFECLGY